MFHLLLTRMRVLPTDDRLRCRWLAVTAWLVALVWFAVATIGGWGYFPGGLFWWSFAAFPLAATTLAWLARRGRPAPASLVTHGGRIWLALLGLQLIIAACGILAGDSTLFEVAFGALLWPMQLTYAAFPLIATAAAVWLSLRPGNPHV